MAKISDTTTYPVTAPTLDDTLIGTNTTDGVTCNFAMSGILGLAVPTGGTTGQVLAKNSGTAYDTEWADASVGVTDGDKGDVVVSSSGAVWTVDALPQSRITDLVSDLAAKDAALATHDADTISIHGIADTSLLLTTSAAAAAYQPLDSGLTAIAALSTTSFGRALLALADAAALRTAGDLVIGTNVQASDATLTSLAAYNTNGLLTQTAADTFTGRTVTGTASRLTVTNGDGVAGNPTLDISSSYAGQATITTLGTVATGTWQGTAIAPGFGGSGQTSYAVGDLLYASATTTLAKLADVATGNALISGGVTTAPAWGKIALTTHVSGILPAANGGALAQGRPKTGVTSAFIIPGVEGTGVGTVALTANQARYEQFEVATQITIDQVLLEVTSTGGAGKLVRIAIYNMDVDGQPTSLVYDAGTIAADSVTAQTITLGVAQTLAPGRYFFAVNSDGTPTMRCIRAGSKFAGYSASFGASPFNVSFTVAQTYGAFPGTGLAWTAMNNGGGSPAQHCVLCHVSAA